MDHPLLWVLIAIMAVLLLVSLAAGRSDKRYKRDRLLNDTGKRRDPDDDDEDPRLILQEW